MYSYIAGTTVANPNKSPTGPVTDCPVCGKSFSKSNYKSHMLKVQFEQALSNFPQWRMPISQYFGINNFFSKKLHHN